MTPIYAVAVAKCLYVAGLLAFGNRWARDILDDFDGEYDAFDKVRGALIVIAWPLYAGVVFALFGAVGVIRLFRDTVSS